MAEEPEISATSKEYLVEAMRSYLSGIPPAAPSGVLAARGSWSMPPVERPLRALGSLVPTAYSPPTSRGSAQWPIVQALLASGATLAPRAGIIDSLRHAPLPTRTEIVAQVYAGRS